MRSSGMLRNSEEGNSGNLKSFPKNSLKGLLGLWSGPRACGLLPAVKAQSHYK